jgi:hypothetical protein
MAENRVVNILAMLFKAWIYLDVDSASLAQFGHILFFFQIRILLTFIKYNELFVDIILGVVVAKKFSKLF